MLTRVNTCKLVHLSICFCSVTNTSLQTAQRYETTSIKLWQKSVTWKMLRYATT